MARMHQWIGLAAVGLFLTGCVPQEKYSALKLDDDQLREQLGQSQTETQQAQAEAAAYKQQLAAFNSSGNSNAAIVANLTQQNASLQQQLDDMNRRYNDAISLAGRAGGTALPEPLSNALSDFAAQNPDLVDFDAARGIVKFRSDVTFAVGDATVTAKARDVLSRFATILDSSAANGYELLVAGHTDNTPVVNPETIRKGHLDNWYLSAHRAISVSKELIADGVSPRRFGRGWICRSTPDRIQRQRERQVPESARRSTDSSDLGARLWVCQFIGFLLQRSDEAIAPGRSTGPEQRRLGRNGNEQITARRKTNAQLKPTAGPWVFFVARMQPIHTMP